MKTYLNKLKFLVISALLFSIAVAIERSSVEPQNYELDTKKFESVLHAKERKLDNLLSTFADKIKKKEFSRSAKDALLFNLNFNELSKEGFIFLFYENDSLKFWSDNSIDVSPTFSTSGLNNRITNLNNAWYVYKILNNNKQTVIGLIKIKNKYSIQNKYLVNEFQTGFNLPASVQVSMIPLSYGFDIQDKEHNYIFSLIPTNTVIVRDKHSTVISIFYFLGIIVLLFYIQTIINQLKRSSKSQWFIAFIILIVLVVRFLMQEFKLPINLYSLNFFDPKLFASIFFPSLGDFFINIIVITFVVYNVLYLSFVSQLFKLVGERKGIWIHVATGVSFLLIIGVFLVSQVLFKSLLFNSNISFEVYRVLNLNAFSLIGFLIIALIISMFLHFANVLITYLSEIVSVKLFYFYFVLFLLLAVVASILFHYELNPSSIVFYIVSMTLFSILRFKKYPIYYYTNVLIIFVVAVYTVAFISLADNTKNKEISKLLVTKLTNERDNVAELLIKENEANIKNDEAVQNYFQNNSEDLNDKVFKHLQKKYFHGYWDKYDLKVIIKNPAIDSTSIGEPDDEEKYFNQLMDKSESEVPNTNYYFLENQNGTISYVTKVAYRAGKSNYMARVYIKLDSKLLTQELGYPDLLLEDKMNKTSAMSDYSYAKYKNNRLVKRTGTYHYDFNDNAFPATRNEYSFTQLAGFDHLIYKIDDKNTIILSKPSVKLFDTLISFAYIFAFFNILLAIYILFQNLPTLWKNFEFNFKMKLQFSMIFILLLSFLLVGGGTVYYNIRQFERKHNDNITEKIQSVLIELGQKFGSEKELPTNWSTNESNYLDELLMKLSQVFFSDINLYDLDGNLIGTSRPEIFKRGLIGRRMNPVAFNNMVINQKTEFIQDEKIGLLNYSSSYLPFENNDRKQLAYINLPFFTKPSILREEISTLLVAVLNLYVVLFLVAIVIAVFISTKITQPLRFIQTKFQQIELGANYEQIDYKGKDEIGGLVGEYNRMVEKLADSIELLAKSERESAWREMAKQIAHEIKNPLTPMKLSIQYLLRSWENKDPKFGNKLESVTRTLIDQIDTLTAIASEFSAFAKMPRANEEVIDLVAKIESIVKLFENTENVQVITNLYDLRKVSIVADKEHISRVFINLIKNAIQSIPDGINGKVMVEMKRENNHVLVKVEDNGIGISDEQKAKMFTPSFTTKTSGMGLGLPIVKNIVNNANGKIWFETELGKGTKFFVEFPVAEES